MEPPYVFFFLIVDTLLEIIESIQTMNSGLFFQTSKGYEDLFGKLEVHVNLVYPNEVRK